MGLLTDEQLVTRVRAGLVTGLIPPADWFTAESPVQPASADLHIGRIFLPGVAAGSPGSAERPLTSISLAPGASAVIATKEQVNLPADVAAMCAVSSQLALEGLLLTNPGYIDPGFQGFLHLTATNLSKDAHPLTAATQILKLAFFQLPTPVKKGLRDRNPGGHPSVVSSALGKLPGTLLDIDERALPSRPSVCATGKETACSCGADS